jgi:hypothetical protein
MAVCTHHWMAEYGTQAVSGMAVLLHRCFLINGMVMGPVWLGQYGHQLWQWHAALLAFIPVVGWWVPHMSTHPVPEFLMKPFILPQWLSVTAHSVFQILWYFIFTDIQYLFLCFTDYLNTTINSHDMLITLLIMFPCSLGLCVDSITWFEGMVPYFHFIFIYLL